MCSQHRLLLILFSALSLFRLEAFDRDDVIEWYHIVKEYVDSADIKGADRAYLELPRQGFLAYAQGSVTGTHLNINYTLAESASGVVKLKGNLNSLRSQMLSLGVTYRGWGLSYSQDIASHDDTEWSFSTYGQTYGFETRLHTTNTLNGNLEGHFADDVTRPVLSVGLSSISQRTWLANFYWVFNHRRFSIPAAMSQTVIQRRSAGSFLAIVNYHRVSTTVDDPALSFYLAPAFQPEGEQVRSQFRKLLQSQISIGGGYAYNYVFPNQRLLLHGSYMPMLSVWHRNRTTWEQFEHDVDGHFLRETEYQRTMGQRFLTFNSSMHLSLIYNKDRYSCGMLSMLNIDSLPSRNSLTIYTFDWDARLFFGVRF